VLNITILNYYKWTKLFNQKALKTKSHVMSLELPESDLFFIPRYTLL